MEEIAGGANGIKLHGSVVNQILYAVVAIQVARHQAACRWSTATTHTDSMPHTHVHGPPLYLCLLRCHTSMPKAEDWLSRSEIFVGLARNSGKSDGSTWNFG